MKYLKQEHGIAMLDAMASIMHALDPDGNHEPGKIVAANS